MHLPPATPYILLPIMVQILITFGFLYAPLVLQPTAVYLPPFYSISRVSKRFLQKGQMAFWGFAGHTYLLHVLSFCFVYNSLKMLKPLLAWAGFGLLAITNGKLL